MKNLSRKIGFALLTFFASAILALIWFTLDNKSAETIKAQSRPYAIEIPVPKVKILEPLSDYTASIIPISSKNSLAIRYIKSGGKFCVTYLLNKIAKDKSANSYWDRLKKFSPNDESLSPNIKKWLEYMRKDELLVAELKNNKLKALLLSSTSYRATGLATSLENWHIEIDNLYSGEFWSFSKNPKLVFWDKDGFLNYYSVIYSDAFLSATSERDYNNLTVNIERYKINLDGKAQLISKEQNLRCE